jgi:hydroxysqualene dehydroxylase
VTGGTVHVVGAGLAGLSAATRLAELGRVVRLYDSAKAAGGRCRSYHDATLDLTIDNGNHLLLSGNHSALAFVDRVGGRDALTIADEASFPFVDLSSGERWTLRPNRGRLPWWIFVAARRVPGTRTSEYLAPLGILRARTGTTIGEAMRCSGPLYRRLWQPVLLAALNTEPTESAAHLAAPILRETLGAGGEACRPVIATGGLSAAFVDPALDYLRARGATVRFGARLRAIEIADGKVAALSFGDDAVRLGPSDSVVLALPAWQAQELVPGLSAPDEHRGILNAHFRVAPPSNAPLLIGVVGGTTEWIFSYPDRISVTISAADRLFDTDREELARTIWAEIRTALRLSGDLPRWQIVKERRATFAATPAQDRKRPGGRTDLANLVLAGDWTATGLPSTIEGAIRSGEFAASLLQHGDGEISRSVSKA